MIFLLSYLICLTIAPVFLTAAIYLCLARIVVLYGEVNSRLKPRTYTIMFVTFDFTSLVFQAIGGAIAATSNTDSSTQVGVNIMIAGLSWQVASLLVFMAFCTDFAITARRSVKQTQHSEIRQSKRFRAFILCKPLTTSHLRSALTSISSPYLCHSPHLRTMCLPSRRIIQGLQWSYREQSNRIHDPRGRHVDPRMQLAVSLPSRTSVPGSMGLDEFLSPREEES